MISKLEARQKILSLRKNLQFSILNEKFQDMVRVNILDIINKSNIIASYINFDCEPNINSVLGQYKDLIYLPVIQKKNEKMLFQSWDFNPTHLKKNSMFTKKIIYEPFGEFIRTEIPNLVFVPAVAFDTKGNRVGYGAGYYDKTLESMENVIKIGVAFDFQIFDEEIEVEDYDIKMDYVLTEKKLMNFN